MRQRILPTICAVLAACGNLIGQTDSQAYAKISGIVVNQATQEPIDGVELWFKPDSGGTLSTRTNREGKFALDLSAHQYDITLSRSGFSEVAGSQMLRRLTLQQGEEHKDLRFEMVPNAAVSGRVFDQDGQPLSPAIVLALKADYLNGHRVLLPGGLISKLLYLPFGPDTMSLEFSPENLSIMALPRQSRTNENGEYRIFGLPPGKYYLAIWQKGPENPTTDLPPIYYPGVIDPATAVPVQLGSGSETPGLDIRVPSIEAYSARFKISDPPAPFNCTVPPDASSIAKTLVIKFFMLVQHSAAVDVVHFANSRMIREDRELGGDNVAVTRLRALGNQEWETGKLAPGSYELFVGGCGLSGLRPLGRLPFEIVDQDIDAGTLQLSAASTLRGQVHAPIGTTVRFSDLYLRLRPTDWRGFNPGLAPNPTPIGRLQVDADGQFAFQNRWNANTTWGAVSPGHYQIDVGGLPPEVYVASIKYEAKEVRDNGIDVGAEITGDLEIMLDSPGGTVSGVVFDRQGNTFPSAAIVLVPPHIEGAVRLPSTTRSDQNGAFLFRGVAPGSYTVFAWDRPDPGAYDDPEFLQANQSRGARIQINKGSATNLELRVIVDN